MIKYDRLWKPMKEKGISQYAYIQHSISIAHNLIAYAITKTYRSIRLINCAIFYIVGLRTSWSISMMTILFDRHPGNRDACFIFDGTGIMPSESPQSRTMRHSEIGPIPLQLWTAWGAFYFCRMLCGARSPRSIL